MCSCKKSNYGLDPDTKEYNEYNRRHPVKRTLKPFHPNIRNDINIREFVVGTTMFYGELDGYGRTPFAYSGLANNPIDQEVLKNIINESIEDIKHKETKKDNRLIRHKIDSLLSYKVYKGKNRKERTINEIMKLCR
jgi:hypothetical protein